MIYTRDLWVVFCNLSPSGICGLIFKSVDPFIQLLIKLGFKEKMKTRLSLEILKMTVWILGSGPEHAAVRGVLQVTELGREQRHRRTELGTAAENPQMSGLTVGT